MDFEPPRRQGRQGDLLGGTGQAGRRRGIARFFRRAFERPPVCWAMGAPACASLYAVLGEVETFDGLNGYEPGRVRESYIGEGGMSSVKCGRAGLEHKGPSS